MSALYNGQTTSVNHATEQPSPEDSAQLQVDNKVTSKSSTSGVSNATAERGKTRITCPVTVVNGLDFLKASFWIEWESFDLLDQLERLKECVQSTEDESIPVDLSKGFKVSG